MSPDKKNMPYSSGHQYNPNLYDLSEKQAAYIALQHRETKLNISAELEADIQAYKLENSGKLDKLKVNIRDLELRIKEIETNLSSLASKHELKDEYAKLNAAIGKLEGKLEVLEKEQSKMNNIIYVTIIAAIVLPILKSLFS